MNHNDLMLDLETFNNTPNSVTVQIGACYFDRNTGNTGAEFIKNVDADSEAANGFEFGGDTIYWWMQQSDDARESLMSNRAESYIAWFELNTFIAKATSVWSYKPFDYVITSEHFDRLGITPNVNFRMAKDLITLMDNAQMSVQEKDSFPKVGTHHNALDDCKYQVQYAVECFKRIKKGV